MPDIFYDVLDAVPEGLREFAKAEGDKVVVKVVPAVKLDEFRENNIKVSKERDDAAQALAKAKEILGTEDFDAATSELTKLRETARKVADGQLVEGKGLDEALQERTKQMRESLEAQIGEKAREAQAWREKATQFDAKYRRTIIDRAITDVVLDESIGVHSKALADILGRAYSTFNVSDDGKLTPLRGDAPLYGADGVSPMTPKEWVMTLKEDAPYFFKGSNGGGSNGGDAITLAGMTQAEINKLPPEQRLAIANGEYGKRR